MDDNAKTERHAPGRPLAAALAAALIAFALTLAAVPAEAHAATTVKVTVGAKAFKAKLADNATAAALYRLLPKTYKMSELNGNEKYRYLKSPLPSDEKRCKKVRAGDVMLFGDDCLVLFYKTHKTSYEYTKVGRLTSTKGLAKAVGEKSVKVRFAKIRGQKAPASKAASVSLTAARTR